MSQSGVSQSGLSQSGLTDGVRMASRPDERQSLYCPVECRVCGAVVLAAKFSVQHTSVQWDAAAVRQCAEFARRTAAGEQTPLIERCSAMRASIETAALEGRLPVAPP